MTDVRRLGQRGSYRLGRLRAQGTGPAAAPAPLRPSFIRSRHRGPTAAWLLAAAAGVAAVTGGAAAGLWFAPFAVGLLAGAASQLGAWRARTAGAAVTIMALVGWGIPLGRTVAHGPQAGTAARAVAALAGLPTSLVAGLAATLLVAVLQALAALWLGRALTPRPALDRLA